MTSLFRKATALCLVSSALVGSLLVGATQVFALTQEQIIQKLKPIPIFVLSGSKGEILSVAPPNGQKGRSLAGAFISRKDAQSFLDNVVKGKDPNLAKNGVQVVPIPLAAIYQMNQASKDKPDQPFFDYVPARQQVESAVALLKQGGVKVDRFNVTPLFALVSKKGKETGFVVVQRGDQKSIPLFFDKEQSQALLDSLKKQEAGLASNTEIEVLSLEEVIANLQSTNNKDPKQEEFLSQIELVRSQEANEFIKSISPQQGAPAPGNKKPAAAPAPKK